MRCLFLMLVLLCAPVWAQVQVRPAELAPDQPFAVEIHTVLPTPCSLAGDWSLVRRDDQLILGVQPALVLCIEVLSPFDGVIGPFRLDGTVAAGETLEVVVVIDPFGTPLEIGRGSLTVVAAAEPGDELMPGLYWDPQLAGIGVAVSATADDMFLATFGFDGNGQPEWTIGQGRFDGRVLDDELLSIDGGPCLRCGPAPTGPLQARSAGPLSLIVTGPFAGVLLTGETPRRGLLLQPFELRTVMSEGTIAGETFEMPDLTGRWLFSDPQGTSAFTTDLAQVATGFADSGMAWFESTDGAVRLECSGAIDVRFRCRLFTDELLVATADASGISSRVIRSSDLIGLRLSP